MVVGWEKKKPNNEFSTSLSPFLPSLCLLSLFPLLLLVLVRVHVLADLLVHREHRDRRGEERLELALDEDLPLVGGVLQVLGLDVLLFDGFF